MGQDCTTIGQNMSGLYQGHWHSHSRPNTHIRGRPLLSFFHCSGKQSRSSTRYLHILHCPPPKDRDQERDTMVKPIPENIKACLSELSAAQQVLLRGYLGTLRAEIKDLEEQLRTLQDPDPHAHYHGHEKCTCEYSV